METHNIDLFIKKAIDESANFYDIEANKAKEKIWKHVQLQKQNHHRPILIRSLVAACILLFISTSVISLSLIKTKKTIKTLVELNNTLKDYTIESNQNTLTKKEPVIAANANSPDTVFIEKNVVVSKPVIITKQIIDTVFIRQIVYVEKEQAQETLTAIENSYPTDSIFQSNANNYETEILISNNEKVKREKGKKIQIKFGGNKDQTSSGTLAFTTEF